MDRRLISLVAAAVFLCFVPVALSSTVTLLALRDADIAGCEMHVVESQANEQIAPCGAATHLSGRSAVGWIETQKSIAPFLTDVTQGGRISIGPLVRSGLVSFSSHHHLREGERIRLLSLISPQAGATLRRLFVRDVTSLQAKSRMPAGPAIALLIDKGGRYVAVSRPIVVQPGIETTAWPDSPSRTEGTVVVWLTRPRAAERPDQDRVAVMLADDKAARTPIAFVNAADSVFAVWYGVNTSSARLVVSSAELHLSRDTIAVARGEVTTVAEALRVLPALTVKIAPLPRDVRSGPMSLSVGETRDEPRAIRTLAVEAGKSYSIASLPAVLLTLNLNIGDFVLQQHADLTSGDDTIAAIALNPSIVSGIVYRGDLPARARLRFLQAGQPLSVETDAAGNYTITLWQPRRYIVETTPIGFTLPPFSQDVLITASQTLDIHIPASSLSAKVYDAATGERVEGARIMIHNRWSEGSSVTTVPAREIMNELPPLKAGTAEIRAHAEGYADAGPVVVQVHEGDASGVVELPMKRLTDVLDVEIRLHSDAPAAGAEIAAFSGEELTWQATADERGQVAIPAALATKRLLVRHPSAASEVTIFGPGSTNEIILRPAAPPLIIRVVDRDHTPVAARVTFVRGVRLSGAETAFVTWSLGATPPDGTLIMNGLPPQALRAFATRKASRAEIQSGSFDALATTIPYPWPAVAILPLVDD